MNQPCLMITALPRITNRVHILAQAELKMLWQRYYMWHVEKCRRGKWSIVYLHCHIPDMYICIFVHMYIYRDIHIFVYIYICNRYIHTVHYQ